MAPSANDLPEVCEGMNPPNPRLQRAALCAAAEPLGRSKLGTVYVTATRHLSATC